MTDSTSFLEGPAEADAPASKRMVLLAGGVAAALALAAGGYFLVLGGGGSEDLSAASGTPVTRGVTTKGTASTTTKTARKPVAQIPAASAVKLGRDPFRALYVEPVVAAPGGAAAGTTTTGTTTTGTTTTGGTTSGSAPATATTPAATAPYDLKLLSVTVKGGDVQSYRFSVGGRNASVLAGQRFGKYGELVVLAAVKSSSGAITGAMVQVGDDNPVEVSVGEKISVL